MPRAKTNRLAKAQDAYAQQQCTENPECCTGSIALFSEDREEVKILPCRCKRWDCKSCAPYKRAIAQMEIRRGHPERHIVLTARPQPKLSQIEHLRRMKTAFSRLVRKIRRHGWTFEYWATWEFHENGAPHVHVLQRGRYISQRYLAEMWQALTGNYIVSIDRVNNVKAGAAELTKYLTKTAAAVKEKAPRLKIYTKSQNWEIDDPETDPSYNEDTWQCVFLPGMPAEVAEMLRACGCDVDDPESIFQPWTVRGSPGVPDLLNNVHPADLPAAEYDIVYTARLILRGSKHLAREKKLNKMMKQMQHSMPVYDDRELQHQPGTLESDVKTVTAAADLF